MSHPNWNPHHLCNKGRLMADFPGTVSVSMRSLVEHLQAVNTDGFSDEEGGIFIKVIFIGIVSIIVIHHHANATICCLVISPSNDSSAWVAWISYTVFPYHWSDVIMGAMASKITSLMIVYATVYTGADQRKHQNSASLAFVRGIHRWPVYSRKNGQ